MKNKIVRLLTIGLCIALLTACGSRKTDLADQSSGDGVVENGENGNADTSDPGTDDLTDGEGTGDVNGEDQKNDQTEDQKNDQTEDLKDDQKDDQTEENQNGQTADGKEDQTSEAEPEEKVLEPAPALKEVYDGMFEIGVCLNNMTAGSMYRDDVVKNFTSVTCENEMKPDYLLDQSASRAGVADDPTFVAVNFSNCNGIVKYCEENGLKMRFHTLAWHAQTPNWFFYEDYDTAKKLVSKEVMVERLKNYIFQVVDYFDTEHPGLIYTIDVVNEAFNGNGTYGTTDTNNKWYEVMGSDYVYYAFLYAREAIDNSKNMKDCVLVYNDYSMMWKASVVPNGLKNIFGEHGADPHDYIDALGMQSHLDTDTSIQNFLIAAKQFLAEGYELQITELDIGIPNQKRGAEVSEKDLLKQGQKYRYLMDGLVDLKKQGYNITGVTVWGINDANSWRSDENGMDAHALLWKKGMVEKPAVRGFALCDDIVSYYTYGIKF